MSNMGALILVANPGSASRKYALFEGETERAGLHFEWYQGKIICTLIRGDEQHLVHTEITGLDSAASEVVTIFTAQNMLQPGERIEQVGLRIVAPSSYFLKDRVVDDEFVEQLTQAQSRAPLHIAAILHELDRLREQFPDARLVGASDSAFHATKPDYAWNYGISLDIADHFEIKRFGYHGLSVESVVRELKNAEKLPPKLIVCHLGSGASVSAMHGGKSLDNSMGYSPLEGVVMSTGSGSIDPTAVRALKQVCNFDDDKIEDFLNNRCGLLGLGGTPDIRELLRRESDGDEQARLALTTYIYSVQKAVGQMVAALGGADVLVFTGMVGERSAIIRSRITARLHYLDFILDDGTNPNCEAPTDLTLISRLAHSKPVYVAPTHEATEIARRVQSLLA
jgi:acetate kinase